MFAPSSRRLLPCSLAILHLLLAGLSAAPEGTESAPAGDDAFFEEQILPIFRDRCYECHSHTSGKMKGGLALDSRSGWSEGGESGAAVNPGKPDDSLLIKAVRRVEPDTAMPPKKPLPDSEVALLTDWVRRGAPDPRVSPPLSAPTKDWWSLKPIASKSSLCSETNGSAVIDKFVAQKLAENGMSMAPAADRRALIRRLYFDLHGLAPSASEVDEFEVDPDPLAYEKLVDRLLASPRYGERWARHWFDTIHFADTHGFEHDQIRENAWRYRDYVINALNNDIAWAQFIREQVAADAFEPEEPRLNAALGFLGAGPFDLSAAETAPKMFEVIDRDDMVVQTMAAFTSTTVGCARCHDHKFDPITQKDYYSLAAIFAGIAKGDITYDENPAVAQERTRWQQMADAAAKKDASVLLGADSRSEVEAWESARLPAAEWNALRPTECESAGGAMLQIQEDGSVLSAGERPDKETLTLTFRTSLANVTALRLEALTDASLPKGGPGRQDNGNFHLNECDVFVKSEDSAGQAQAIPISRATADFNQDGWTINHALDRLENTAWGIFPRVGETHQAILELKQPLSLRDGESLRVVLRQIHGAGHVIGRVRLSCTSSATERLEILPGLVADVLPISPAERSETQLLALAAHVVSARAAAELGKLPAQAKIYAAARSVTRGEKKVALAEPRVIHVLARGDLEKPTDVAKPNSLECLLGLVPEIKVPPDSGEMARRAALADWLAHPDNPLTWRSVVNRVWHYHFGRGLVETPNDFGRMGSAPSHPELLDWLAADFRDSGGSLKRLHRQIVLSGAYREACDPSPGANAAGLDPENHWLWHANRQRLDAEAYRDIVLQLAGQLDLTMGGPPVMHFKLGPPVQSTPTLDYTAFDWSRPGVNRRSVYRLVYRNIADPFMTALDFPDAAQLAPVRGFSASPIQALALWNDAFVLTKCDAIARCLENASADPSSRVNAAVLQILLRKARPGETEELTKYAERHGLAALCRVLINTNEFLFVE